MPWFPLSDELYRDPRFAGLSGDGLALWTRAASWSADRLSDGFVPATMLATFNGATPDQAAELVENVVWKRVRGGFQFLDWPAFVTKEKVEAKRAADNKRQGRYRSSKGSVSRRDTRRDTTRDSQQDSRQDSPATRRRPNTYSVTNVTGADAHPESINVQTVVGAWVEAMEHNDVHATPSLKAQAGRAVKELFEAGNDPTKILAAARQCGRKGYATVANEFASMNGRNVRSLPGGRPAPGYDEHGQMRDPKSGVLIER